LVAGGKTYQALTSSGAETPARTNDLRGVLMVPLDGMCRFSKAGRLPIASPYQEAGCLLHPKIIGLAGVSTTRMNFGRIILNNILANGFAPRDTRLIKPGLETFVRIRCVADPASLDVKLDLFVDKIREARLNADGGPVFLGAIGLGVVSHPGKYDTMFMPEAKLPKRRGSCKRSAALVSQSRPLCSLALERPEHALPMMISIPWGLLTG
jgi:hypothetical protein